MEGTEVTPDQGVSPKKKVVMRPGRQLDRLWPTDQGLDGSSPIPTNDLSNIFHGLAGPMLRHKPDTGITG